MKVICALCEFEKGGLCTKKKNNKVHLNKKRKCSVYKQSDEKVNALVDKRLNTPRPEVTWRPDWWHDRRAYINKLKKLDKEKQRREEVGAGTTPKQMPIESVKHPLTGDLSRFTSTVGSKVSQTPNMKNK